MAEFKLETQTFEKIHMAIASKLENGVSYIDALVEYSKEKGIEIEVIGEIVKKSSIMKEKIRGEAIAARLVKKDKTVATIC